MDRFGRLGCALVGWLALGLVASLPGWARAEPKPEDLAHARQLMTQAGDDYTRNDFDGALRHYEAAYVIVNSPKLLFNIAQCHLALGHEPDAAQSFAQFLGGTEQGQSNIADYRSQAREKLAILEPKLGRLLLSAEPAQARMVLDGRPVKPGLAYVSAAPTPHDLVVAAPGYVGASRTLSVEPGKLLDVSITLEAEHKAELPVVALMPPPKQPPAAAVTSEPAPPAPNRTPALIALGGAGALALAGLTMGLVTHQQYQALPDNPSGAATPAESAVLRNARITDALWAGAAVAAGAGGYLWFSASPAPGGGQVAAGGKF